MGTCRARTCAQHTARVQVSLCTGPTLDFRNGVSEPVVLLSCGYHAYRASESSPVPVPQWGYMGLQEAVTRAWWKVVGGGRPEMSRSKHTTYCDAWQAEDLFGRVCLVVEISTGEICPYQLDGAVCCCAV